MGAGAKSLLQTVASWHKLFIPKFSMPPFTLATLFSPKEPRAAIGVEGNYYFIHEIEPELHCTVRSLLDNWETSLPLLEDLADRVIAGKFGTVDRIDRSMAVVSSNQAIAFTPKSRASAVWMPR
jgi:hypothetical protein